MDWTGKTTPGGLNVIGLKSRRPVAWKVRCAGCGAETVIPHSRIEYAECQSSACKLPVRKRTRDDEERERRVARERAALLEENRIAELRMARETADHTIKSSRPPVPEYVPMSDRDRQAIRARREEEHREEEERQRPIKEATEQLNAMHREIAKIQADTLTNDKVLDADLWIDPTVDGIEMKKSEAAKFNKYHLTLFAEEHPNIAGTERNARLLVNYFEKHGLHIVTFQMLERLFQRLVAAGVFFDEKPAPEPEPMDYSKRDPVEVRIAPPVKPQPVTYRGWDEDGNEREYTEREVSRWSSSEMKRRLRLTAASGALDLPNVGPGPKGSKG